MFELRSGQENALGMLLEDTNCPVSVRRWFVEKFPAYEPSESSDADEPTDLDEKVLTKKLSPNCDRPHNSIRGTEIMIGTDCPSKYVKGFLIMKPETWMAADIVSRWDNFDDC
jgi:hypothetical protein